MVLNCRRFSYFQPFIYIYIYRERERERERKRERERAIGHALMLQVCHLGMGREKTKKATKRHRKESV